MTARSLWIVEQGGQPDKPAPQGLARYSAEIDARLARYLDERVQRAGDVSPIAARAVSVLRHFALRGGLRIRAMLMRLGYLAAGGDSVAAIDEATPAIEMLHAFLVIHDDVIDDTETRRGGPALHREYAEGGRRGDAFAIVAGDFACGYAHDILLTAPFPPDRVNAAGRFLGSLIERIGFAKWSELGGGDGAESTDALTERTSAYAIAGPLELGAVLAWASEQQRAALRAFAGPLGHVYHARASGAEGDGRAVEDLLRECERALDRAPLHPGATKQLKDLAAAIVARA